MIPHWAGHPEGKEGLGGCWLDLSGGVHPNTEGKAQVMGTENIHQCTGPQS